MTKRFIIIALVLVLVCGALFVSCKPDPVKDNKAIGDWWTNEWTGEMYDDIQLTVKADKTFEGFIEGEVKAVFSGTWDASSINKGVLTFTDTKETFAVSLNFYADDTNLILYDAKEGGESVTLIRDVPNK